MSLERDWDSASPVAADLSDAWEKAKPIAEPKKAQPKPKSSLGEEIAGAIAEPILAMGTGMIAKPISDIAGLTRLGMEGFRRMGIPGEERDPMTVQRDVMHALTYEPRTAAGRAVTEYNPLALIGKGINRIAQGAESMTSREGSNPLMNMLGYGVHEAVNQLPMFLGMKAPSAAAATESGLQGGARYAMGKALKPTVAEWASGDAEKAITTMLEQKGTNVSRGGVEKLDAKIDLINDKIKEVIADSPARIDKFSIVSGLKSGLDKFKKQATNYGDDIAAIQKAWDRFMSHPLLEGKEMPKRADQDRPPVERTIREAASDQPGPALANTLEQVAGEIPGRFSDPRFIGVPPPAPTIPVQTAQEIKQGTYRVLKDRAYGEMQTASREADKYIARRLKEEIADAVPAVRKLNAEESNLINALSMVERQAYREASRNLTGFAWFTTNPVKFAAYMADKSSLFKSIVARMLSSTSKAIPEMTVAGPVAGAATTEQAEQRKMNQ